MNNTTNKKKRIGIVICSNSYHDMNCNSTMCLMDFQRGNSAFSQYNKSEGAELLGIISCAGCPTLAAPEKILHRIKPMVDLGVNAIHLSSCMLMLCPFKNKYKNLIEKTYPGLTVIEGTHFPPEGMTPEQAGKQIVESAHEMLCSSRPAMSKVALELYPDEFPGTDSNF